MSTLGLACPRASRAEATLELARQCRRTQLLHRERGSEHITTATATTSNTLRTHSSTNRQNRAAKPDMCVVLVARYPGVLNTTWVP